MRETTESRLSVEEELTLRLAATRAQRERSRSKLQELVGRADLERLRGLMAFQRMPALLGRRLMEASDLLPPDLTAEVEEVITAEHRRGVAQELATLRLAAVLEDEGIACLPLKGQTLSRVAHGDVGLRASSDIDLLVRAGQLGQACKALRSCGYGPPADPVYENGLPLLHYALPSTDQVLPSVEVHWRVHWFETGFSERMLLRSTRDAVLWRRGAPADELASLLLFYAREGFTGLRLLADITAWWDLSSNALPAHGLGEIAADHPELTPALRAAAAVCERLGGVPAARLGLPEAPHNRREHLADRLADLTSSSDPDQVAADRWLVDALLMPKSGVPGFIKRQSAIRSGISLMSHLAKLLGRFTVALWRVRGGRELTPAAAGANVANTPSATVPTRG